MVVRDRPFFLTETQFGHTVCHIHFSIVYNLNPVPLVECSITLLTTGVSILFVLS